MLAYHPKHRIILSGTTPSLSSTDPRRFDFDFRELDQAWRLRVLIDPTRGAICPPTLHDAEQTLKAIEYALDARRQNNGSANRYYSDDERQVHANWMKYTGLLMAERAAWLTRQGDSLEASAPTAFKGRRSA